MWYMYMYSIKERCTKVSIQFISGIICTHKYYVDFTNIPMQLVCEKVNQAFTVLQHGNNQFKSTYIKGSSVPVSQLRRPYRPNPARHDHAPLYSGLSV